MANESDPAFHMVADEKTLRLIGELCVILGQIELSMRSCLTALLDVPEPIARRMLGSTKLADNAQLWIEVMRSQCHDHELVQIANEAHKLFQPLTKGRNDFIHSVFVYAQGTNKYMAPPDYSPRAEDRPIAIRLREPEKEIDLAGIGVVRNQAARLSRMLAHLEYCLLADIDAEPSPWLGKF